jgi:hypothetical protein
MIAISRRPTSSGLRPSNAGTLTSRRTEIHGTDTDLNIYPLKR